MKKKALCCGLIVLIGVGFFFLIVITQPTIAEEFQNPQKVNIVGYDQDAMEPFISADGQYLFFNSLNDGKNTSLLYAKATDSTTFQFMGEVQGVNMASPHLDAVASMDDANNFYFITTREYPSNFKNLMTGVFVNGSVLNLTRVEGDFYIEETGWLIMDAEISRDGNTLYVVNAQFTGAAMPTKSDIRIAHKVNGKFMLDTNSATLMKNINTNDLEYAPSTSSDGLMLIYTKAVGTTTTILASKRAATTDPFEKSQKLDLTGLIEATTITKDGARVYYHQKDESKYVIYTMTIVK